MDNISCAYDASGASLATPDPKIRLEVKMQNTEHPSAGQVHLSHPGSGAHAHVSHAPTLEPITPPPVVRLGAAPVSEASVSLSDPAMAVVTNFGLEHPVTVEEDYPIDSALREMKRANVRSMLVMREDQIAGLITSYDIQGERPMQLIGELGLKSHADLEVRHVMKRWGSVPAVDLQAIRGARVSQVVEFFRHSPATHVLIVDGLHAPIRRDEATVCGLISRTRVERQVGFTIR